MLSRALLCLVLFPAVLPAADLPTFADLPAKAELPDPLTMLSGKKITTAAEWTSERKPELRTLFQHYMYGYLPKPVPVSVRTLHEDPKALNGQATMKVLEVSTVANAPPIGVLLLIPNGAKGPVPTFVGMNFCGNHAVLNDPKIPLPTAWLYPNRKGVVDNKATDAGRGTEFDTWAADAIIGRGYALATFYSGDVDPDRKEVRAGITPFLPKSEHAPAQQTATIAMWAWGYHRVIDALLKDASLDPKRMIAVGHSRLGKTTLLAAAMDDRIALAIPHQAGCGGTAPSRGKVGESVERINTSFPHWFNGAFKEFNKHPEKIPFDQHCLVALCAPRPVLLSNAVEDSWANPAGQFDVLRAAEPVYKLLGAGGCDATTMPAPGKLIPSTLGYYYREGKHSMTREDWKAFLDFADVQLKK